MLCFSISLLKGHGKGMCDCYFLNFNLFTLCAIFHCCFIFQRTTLTRFRKFKNFSNLIKYFSFVAGDFMAYKYNVHGSNPILSIVTVGDNDSPSFSCSLTLFSLSPFISQDPLKRTDIVTGSVGLVPISVLKVGS